MKFFKRLFGRKPPEPNTPEPDNRYPGDPEELRSRLEVSRELARLKKIELNKFHSEIRPLIKRAEAPHRQMLFMLRKAQHELKRQQKFLDNAEKFLLKIEDDYAKDK